jgi:hypothetical protein
MALTYEPINSFTIATAQTSVTFTTIPQTYTDLVIVTNAIANVTGADLFTTHFNGDNASNTYSLQSVYGTGTTFGTYAANNQVGHVIGNLSTNTSSEYALSIFHIMNYTNTTTWKPFLCRSNAVSTSGIYMDLTAGTWRSTSAINTIQMRTVNGYQIKPGSTLTMYGIKAA